MRYLTLYPHPSIVVCIDLHKPNRIEVIDGIYYAEKFDLTGYLSNSKKAFKRTASSTIPLTSRQIAISDFPKKLSSKQVIELLEGLQKRGKDVHKRKMHPNSLANLKPGQRFTAEDHPVKQRKLSEEQLEKAIDLRRNGCSWRKVGDTLECNFQTVRTSLRRRTSEKGQIWGEKSSH
jgi:hypothetical protein